MLLLLLLLRWRTPRTATTWNSWRRIVQLSVNDLWRITHEGPSYVFRSSVLMCAASSLSSSCAPWSSSSRSDDGSRKWGFMNAGKEFIIRMVGDWEAGGRKGVVWAHFRLYSITESWEVYSAYYKKRFPVPKILLRGLIYRETFSHAMI